MYKNTEQYSSNKKRKERERKNKQMEIIDITVLIQILYNNIDYNL